MLYTKMNLWSIGRLWVSGFSRILSPSVLWIPKPCPPRASLYTSAAVPTWPFQSPTGISISMAGTLATAHVIKTFLFRTSSAHLRCVYWLCHVRLEQAFDEVAALPGLHLSLRWRENLLFLLGPNPMSILSGMLPADSGGLNLELSYF